MSRQVGHYSGLAGKSLRKQICGSNQILLLIACTPNEKEEE